MPSVIGYWDIRGLGNPIRLLLEYAGEDYEDKRYSRKPDFSCPEYYEQDKHRLHAEGMPFPNLPYYVDEKVKLSQSNVILRYLGDKHNLSGKEGLQKYEVMVLEQQVFDSRMAFARLCYGPNFENDKEAYINSALPGQLKSFSEYLGQKKWLIGDELTYPDFHLYDLLDSILYLAPHCLDNFENLKSYLKRFEELPKIKEYLASPRYIKWPINAIMAKFGGGNSQPTR